MKHYKLSSVFNFGLGIVAFLFVVGCGSPEKNGGADSIHPSTDSTVQTEVAALGEQQSLKKRSGRDLSSIWIVASELSPMQMVITDSEKRRTGFNPLSAEPLQEIPNSAYFSEYVESPDASGGMGSLQIEVRQPASDEFELRVSTGADGLYKLTVYCQDAAGDPCAVGFDKTAIMPDEIHRYALAFDKSSSTKTCVLGGFAGGGESDEIDRLLSYVNVTTNKTELATGTANINLFVIYGKTIASESFNATLNGADVTNMFAPVAGGHEIVSIPLKTGKNELKLSVNEDIAGEVTTDTDNLAFDVK